MSGLTGKQLDVNAGSRLSPEVSDSLLGTLKYRGYMVLLSIGAVTALASWALEKPAGTANAFDNIVDPLLAVFCILLAGVLLVFKQRALRRVEVVGYLVLAAYFLANVFYITYVGYERINVIADLAEFSSWIPLVYVLAYLIFGARKGLIVSALFYLPLLGLSLPHVARNALSGENLQEAYAFAQIYLSGFVVVILLFISAYFTEAYFKARVSNEAARRLANTDFLTGTSNRRHLYEVLEQEVERSSRNGRPLALIMFDLDHFKQINDTYGHDIGDELLKSITRLVGRNLRKNDRLGRWGGEEFLILAPETTLEKAESLADRSKLAIENEGFKEDAVTASFGVVAYRPEETVNAVLKRADEALYLAKENGRNRVETLG